MATKARTGSDLRKGDVLTARRTGQRSEVVGFAEGKTKVKLRSEYDGKVRLSKNDARELRKRFYL